MPYHDMHDGHPRDSLRAAAPVTPDMIAWLEAIGAEMGRRMVAADERLRAKLAAERGGDL